MQWLSGARRMLTSLPGALLVLLAAFVAVLLELGAVDAESETKSEQTGRARHAGASQPEELGTIAWTRGLAAGLDAAGANGRPVLLLFDEVPGCHTVRTFGARVLSHPLVGEAAESLFVPTVVYNNVGGADAETLERYGEPSWNNPVVRFVDAKGADIAARHAGDYSVAGLARAMAEALEAADRPVPEYLRLLGVGDSAKAQFAMHCFWNGEAQLGELDGVASTRSGFAQGREVVEVTYDPRKLDADSLVAAAKARSVAQAVYLPGGGEEGSRPLEAAPIRESVSDTRYALRRSAWRFVPLTATQKARVNAAVFKQADPVRYVSPRQRALYERVRGSSGCARPDLLDEDDLIVAQARFDAVRCP